MTPRSSKPSTGRVVAAIERRGSQHDNHVEVGTTQILPASALDEDVEISFEEVMLVYIVHELS